MPPPEPLHCSAGSSGIHQFRNPGFKMLSRSQDPSLSLDERLKILYPMVREEETPLPRCWSTKDKFSYIGLSLNNLRVQYKGHGKTHKDASSVRATHPIPASCGIYYFEVKIVSKGRDGYMGVGLCAQGVNMNRLPGWDKQSYGYHGDDGHSFCSSGTGQAYGPTFTTGDVIGCGLNLVDGTCFYTKNGHHLGTAFADLPSQLYPTVGLQTPGEVVDANFGQEPFLFDIEGEMAELRTRIHRDIETFPVPAKHGDWQATLNKLICSYLVHHGFGNTAEAFARATGQDVAEDWSSIRNRQKIQKLVLAGRMGEAIATTDLLYPGFLAKRPSLLFTLKVRQFIEMIGGRDADGNSDVDGDEIISLPSTGTAPDAAKDGSDISDDDDVDADNNDTNDSGGDVVMTNGNKKLVSNGSSAVQMSSNEETMDVDPPPCRLSVASNPARFNSLLLFGKSLKTMQQEMESINESHHETNARMLMDAFALLAYPDPWNSPLGWQLATDQREIISNALNSALIEARGFAARPPLEVALSHGKQLVRTMAAHDIGACAFANLDDFIK